MSSKTAKRLVVGLVTYTYTAFIIAAIWLGPFHGPNGDIDNSEFELLIGIGLGPAMVVIVGGFLYLLFYMGRYAITGKGNL